MTQKQMAIKGYEAAPLETDSRVWVRRDSKGRIRLIRGEVLLSAARGEVYGMNVWDQEAKQKRLSWQITAPGYYRLNQVAGVTIVTPPTVYVEGEEKHNPYKRRDPETGQLVSVVVRKIALGRGPTGNLVAVDQTLELEPLAYLVRDLEVLKNKAPKDIRDMLRSEFEAERKRGDLPGWAFFPVLNTGVDVVGVAAKLSNAEVAKKLKDYQELVLFAERRAVTICERNALKRHPAIAAQTVTVDKNGNARVTVYGWVTDDSAEELQNKALDVAAGRATDVQVVQSRDMAAAEDVATETGDVSPDEQPPELPEGRAVIDVPDVQQEQPAEQPVVRPPEQPAENGDRQARLVQRIEQMEDALAPSAVADARAAAGLEPDTDPGALPPDLQEAYFNELRANLG